MPDIDDDDFMSPVPGWTCDKYLEQYIDCQPYTQHSIRKFIEIVLHRMQVKGEPCGAVMRRSPDVIETDWHIITQADAKPALFLA